MKKMSLLILLIVSLFAASYAQKTGVKKVGNRGTIRQKKDAWQEYKYPDFTVQFPNKPEIKKGVFQLADESVRYSAVDSKGIVYAVEHLKFGKDFWEATKDFEREKTIYDNLELQWTAGYGAELLFRSAIYYQGVSGRDQFFQYKEKSGRVLDVMQKAFLIGDRVFIFRTIIPLQYMKADENSPTDFPSSVKSYFETFKFNRLREEDIASPPPPPLAKPKSN